MREEDADRCPPEQEREGDEAEGLQRKLEAAGIENNLVKVQK